jgi:threonine/homoserine/homoserine lactone efflux protein
LRVEKEVGTRSAVQVTVTAILINILNSEAVDFLSGLPAAVRAPGRVESACAHARLERRFHADDLRGLVGYGLFAAAIRDHAISRPRVVTWMRLSFAGAFAALGAKLALADR